MSPFNENYWGSIRSSCIINNRQFTLSCRCINNYPQLQKEPNLCYPELRIFSPSPSKDWTSESEDISRVFIEKNDLFSIL